MLSKASGVLLPSSFYALLISCVFGLTTITEVPQNCSVLSQATRTFRPFPHVSFAPQEHVCVCTHAVELCKIKTERNRVIANSLLITVKATVNVRSHSSPNQNLWAWLSACYSQPRVQRTSRGAKKEVSTLLWPEGISCSILGLCSLHQRMQAPKGNPQHKRF